jgi:hypothetical protein
MNRIKTAISIIATCALMAGTASAYDLNLGKGQTVAFHGFVSQGYLLSSDYDYLGETTDGGSFQFTEIGVNATYSPFDRTRIAIQGFAFDVGDVGNLKPFLDYASLEYTFSDYFGLRGGRVRRPGGIYNHIQDVDLARTSVLLPQGLYDARWRDFSTSIDGGVAFGNVSLKKAGSLSYEVFCGTVNLSDDGGVAHWILDGQANTTLNSFGSAWEAGGQLWWNTPVDGLRAGIMCANMFNFGFDLTSQVSPIGPFGPIVAYVHSSGDIFIQQYSLEYVWKSWTFQAEYFTYNADLQQDQNVYSGTTPIAASTGPQKVTPDAWYVSAAYRFNKWLEVGSYYTEYYADTSDRSGASRAVSSDGFQKDVALSFRFDPTDWWIIKLEGHYLRGTALLQDQANNPPASRNDDGWWMFGAKTTLSF